MSSWVNNSRLAVAAIFCAAALSLLLVSVLVGQQGRREIVSDDFTRPRPTPTPKRGALLGRIGVAREGIGRPRDLPSDILPRRYRFVESSSPNAKPLAAADTIQQLGITLWRLRPAKPIDKGERILVQENGHSTQWVPERIEIDTPLHEGDRVRLSIESPREGYLYILDRDAYANGKMGDAMMIFPTRHVRGGDNRVAPGKLIDLPAQEDMQSYFSVKPRSSTEGSPQTGEILTLIVTDKPLPLTINDQPVRVSTVDLNRWERDWSAENERYELEGGAGQAWTSAEKEASRAVGSRQLTQTDSAPQTIYRIAMANKTSFLINVSLLYSGSDK